MQERDDLYVSAEDLAALRAALKFNPTPLTFLERRYRVELERLPYVRENTAAAQGRCQVLAELCSTFEKSLE